MIICVLFIIGVVSFALLISIVSKSLLVALQVASLSSLFPSLLFSGLIYPVKSMPQVLQPFSQILPATYFIECIRELFLKGTPLEFLLKQILILLGIGILVLIIAHKKFKKRMTS